MAKKQYFGPWESKAVCPCGHIMHASFGKMWFAQNAHPVCDNCGGSSAYYEMKTLRTVTTFNGWFKFNTYEIEFKDENAPRSCNYCDAKDRRIAELERQLAEKSWAENPDRMGGQFTNEETRR